MATAPTSPVLNNWSVEGDTLAANSAGLRRLFRQDRAVQANGNHKIKN